MPRRHSTNTTVYPEILSYDFVVIHQPARMMMDVDGLTDEFGTLITTYIL